LELPQTSETLLISNFSRNTKKHSTE